MGAEQLGQQRVAFNTRHPLHQHCQPIQISAQSGTILAAYVHGVLDVASEELLYEFSLFVNKDPGKRFKNSLDHLRDDLGLIDIKIREVVGVRRKIKQAVYRLAREMNQLISINFKEKFEEVVPPIPIFKPPDEDFALGTRGKERPTLWIDFQQLLNHLVVG